MHKVSKFLSKHGLSYHHTDQAVFNTASDDAPFPSERDIFTLRKQRGVNLGSWFVLERWIADGPFQHASSPGQSDLDVARGSQAKEILEHHWDTWITPDDFKWLADRGINTVRIPIGYYHVSGADPSVLRGTDFADHLSVYEGAWHRITTAIATARQHGIGVLIDLHAAPGKQNRDAHSGTSSPNLSFFTKHNMAHTTHVLTVLLTQLSRFAESQTPPLRNIVGIELLNEPQPDAHISELDKWYTETGQALRKVDPRIPIYIGDAWQTDRYAGFVEANSNNLAFMVLDHHLYRCFTQQDGNTPVSQHIQNLRDPNADTLKLFARVSEKLQSAGSALVVGEWSGALNPGSLQGVNNEIEMRRDYIAAQLALYERYCAGYYFWTYKKEHAGDKGWSFRDAVDAGVFPSHVGIRADEAWEARYNESNNEADKMRRRTEANDRALNEHARYWDQYPGKYEHWRFEDGFLRGWDDAWLFFTSVSSIPALTTVPELGFKGACAKRRGTEHAREKGSGNLWEFEHGYSQGINLAYDEMMTGK
ncbi:Glucan 1,3-beta-glucosidase 3 [Steccherinum ochraceum]|uniref:Glucan 1,3-beta-glucosidase 3 n=1 Tax=Steccherinum ochraceum TaxID=92696 RepID=A0A4R0RT44_9APHY|nr:Glucan 1,3-beta-glucosidase 3 [Steccherinum ochraceum]